MGKELRGRWRWIRIFCINLEECARSRAQKPKRQWSVLSVQWSEETRAEWLVASEANGDYFARMKRAKGIVRAQVSRETAML